GVEGGRAPGSQRTWVRERLAERLEDGQGRVEIGLLPPDHDAQRGVDGALLSSRDGRIQHPHALGTQGLADLLRDERRDRGHVEKEQALLPALPVARPLPLARPPPLSPPPPLC